MVLLLSLLAAGTADLCHHAWLPSSVSKESCHKPITPGPSDTTQTALSAICPSWESLCGDGGEGTVKLWLLGTERHQQMVH